MLTRIQNDINELITFVKAMMNMRPVSHKEYDTLYDLRQKVVVITSLHTLLCFDSEGGVLLWKDSSLMDILDSTYHLKAHHQIE
jgi:hypothetical protein